MLVNILRKFRKMLEKLSLYLGNFRQNEKALEN